MKKCSVFSDQVFGEAAVGKRQLGWLADLDVNSGAHGDAPYPRWARDRSVRFHDPLRSSGLGWLHLDGWWAFGDAFVPGGTLDKATREPSDQSLGYSLSPSGLDGGSPASEGSVAGFGQTGLLAANGSVTFPAFIFKNALAAYIRKGSRFQVSGFRLQRADAQ